jgi:hypothetical protein
MDDTARAEAFQTECGAAGVRLHTEAFIRRLTDLIAQVRHDQSARDALLAETAGSGIAAGKLIRQRGTDGES